MSARPTILISSTVYDKGELLDQVFAILTGIGYHVWMSDKGTIPIDSKLTAFQNCLAAVENCDLFLGILTGFYGSGIDGSDPSIVHQEFSAAIKLQKRRWFLVDHDVIVVRSFVKAIRQFEKDSGVDVCAKLNLRQHDPISDMRILDMYDEATRSGIDLKERTGNWVQHFRNSKDVLTFIESQLGDPSKYTPES